jgi:hypothetical protein
MAQLALARALLAAGGATTADPTIDALERALALMTSREVRG